MALINYITQINLDFGAVALLRAECERVGMRKPLIVTDAGVRAAGVLDKAPCRFGNGTSVRTRVAKARAVSKTCSFAWQPS